MLGNAHPIVAPYDTFQTADGYVNIAVGNDGLWQRFCQAFGLDEAAADARFLTNAGRITNLDALYAVINGALNPLPTAEVVARLDARGVPCGPINTVEQVFADPQIDELELRRRLPHPTLGEVTLTGFPYRFSATPLAMRHAPPLLGQQTEEILAEAGYSPDEIAQLIASGAAASNVATGAAV
jgi:crotonobetainyl-CoA:carnitine CoA-transferase CaiB-like acyl-CoA transferase